MLTVSWATLYCVVINNRENSLYLKVTIQYDL